MVPERVSEHLGALRLVSAGRGSTSGSGRYPSGCQAQHLVWPPPSLMLPGAALGSLAARFCWQGQHFRLWTVPERVSGPPPLMLPGAALGSLAARFCWRGSTSGSGRCPSAFRGSCDGASRLVSAGRAALQALDGARARFGAPRLDAALGSLAARFCWRAALQALDGTRARFGAPPP